MGVAENLSRGHLVRRLAQCDEEPVEHTGVGPHGPQGAGATFFLSQEGVDGLVPTSGVVPLHQNLCRHDLLPRFDGVTAIHALARREVKQL